jgi:hypothetical protein
MDIKRKTFSKCGTKIQRKGNNKPDCYKIHMLNQAQRRFNLTLPEAYELREYLLAHRKEATLIAHQGVGRIEYSIVVPKIGAMNFIYDDSTMEVVTIY